MPVASYHLTTPGMFFPTMPIVSNRGTRIPKFSAIVNTGQKCQYNNYIPFAI
jgi:hypothetical protein